MVTSASILRKKIKGNISYTSNYSVYCMSSCQRTVQWKFLDLKSIYLSREK